ncbi:DUF3558 family protein [Skermania piniformis]|uniref:DUF3558 domain-containing protein n=1 Tax=Skermania pinensis TaxID=39122 RepID=A0ABX8S719_9ACTN|nr:DUF3558 domain-containing protein [Skermania piniformis]
MRVVRRSGFVVALVLLTAMVLVGGCGRSVDGTAVRSARAAPWDPCSLSDDVIRRAGLDPATRDSASLVNGAGELSCEWHNDDLFMTLTAIAGATIEQVHSGQGNHDFHDAIVGNRTVTTYRDEGDRTGSFCFLVVPLEPAGIALMQVSRTAFTEDTTPMCVWAYRVGDVVVAAMPR